MCPSECQSITPTRTYIPLTHFDIEKDSFQRLTQHSKKKALKLESGVPSIFLSHFYLNFSMRFIYIRNVRKLFSGLEAFIGSSLHWLAVYSVKS